MKRNMLARFLIASVTLFVLWQPTTNQHQALAQSAQDLATQDIQMDQSLENQTTQYDSQNRPLVTTGSGDHSGRPYRIMYTWFSTSHRGGVRIDSYVSDLFMASYQVEAKDTTLATPPQLGFVTATNYRGDTVTATTTLTEALSVVRWTGTRTIGGVPQSISVDVNTNTPEIVGGNINGFQLPVQADISRVARLQIPLCLLICGAIFAICLILGNPFPVCLAAFFDCLASVCPLIP